MLAASRVADGNRGPPTCLAQGGKTMWPSLRATRAGPRAKEGWDKMDEPRELDADSTLLRSGRTLRRGKADDPILNRVFIRFPTPEPRQPRIPMSDGEEGDPILQRMFIRFPGPEERAMRSSREESKPEPKPTWVAPLQAHRFARRGRRAPRRLEESGRRSLRLRVDRLSRGRPVDRALSAHP